MICQTRAQAVCWVKLNVDQILNVDRHMQSPGLAVVLVGSRGDSATYVRSKKKACADVGIESFGTELPEDVSEEDLLKARPLLVLQSHLHTSRHCNQLSIAGGLQELRVVMHKSRHWSGNPTVTCMTCCT